MNFLEVAPGLRVVGSELQGAAEMAGGFIEVALLAQGDAEVIVDFRHVRLQGERVAMMRDCLIEASQAKEDNPEVGVGIDRVGVEIENGGELAECFLVPAELGVSDAQFVMQGGGFRAEGEGAFEARGGVLGTVERHEKMAELEVCLGFLGIEAQGLAGGGDCFGQLALFVKELAEVEPGKDGVGQVGSAVDQGADLQFATGLAQVGVIDQVETERVMSGVLLPEGGKAFALSRGGACQIDHSGKGAVDGEGVGGEVDLGVHIGGNEVQAVLGFGAQPASGAQGIPDGG